MARAVKPILISLLAVAPGLAMATPLVPDQVAKDAHDGYFHRVLNEVTPLLKDHSQDAEVQFRYGQALLGVGKWEEAIAPLNTAISLDPKAGDYHRVLGEAYGMKAQNSGIFSAVGAAKTALKEFQAAAQLAPDDVDAHVDLAQFYLAAPGFMGGGADKAHVEEDALAKLDKLQALQVRATEAEGNKDYAAEESLLKQADSEDKTAGSLVALGLAYNSQKKYDAAFQAFRDAAAKDSKAYGAWYQMGRVAGFARTNYAEGMDCLKRYIAAAEIPDTIPDTEPSLGWAHLRLGNLYEYQGKKAEALAEYKLAESLQGEDENLASEAKKAVGRLD